MKNGSGRQPAGSSIASRVRLVHLLYAAALIYLGYVTFGVSGILLAVVLCAAWARVYWSESRTPTLAGTLLIMLSLGCLYALLAPAFSAARDRTRRRDCPNNLKQIAYALHNYHDVFKTFPPAYIADESGRPLHSWRVLILPFLEQQPIYEAYRFDEPWDGPNNCKLATPMPLVYSCTSHRPHDLEASAYTSYVAVVGENTMWPEQNGRRIGDIVDGTSQSLHVSELASRQINWMEPSDINYDDAIQLLTSQDSYPYTGHIFQSFFYEWSYGRTIALARIIHESGNS